MQANPNKHPEYETITYHTINKMNFTIRTLSYRTYHMHCDIEVIQIISGSLHVDTPEESFHLKCGEIAYFNPNQPHACHSLTPEPCVLLVLHFDPSFCSDYFPLLQNLYFETSYLPNVLPSQQIEELKTVCFHIGYNFFGQKTGYEFRCMSDVNRFLDYILCYVPHHLVSEDAYRQNLAVEKRMERILNYLHQHFREKISLQDIADSESISASYLSWFFKKNLHKSFQEYVNELRFEHAVFLLRNTNLKIIDVCMESGFSDSKYLNKMFMQVYETTPSVFRKQFTVTDLPKSRGKATTSERLLDMKESLAVLRESHFYRCDDGFHLNSIHS